MSNRLRVAANGPRLLADRWNACCCPGLLSAADMFRRANIFLTFISANVMNRHAVATTPATIGLLEVFGVNLLAITQRQQDGTLPHARRLMANVVLTRMLPGSFPCRAPLERAATASSPRTDQAFAQSFYLRWCTRPPRNAPAWQRRAVFLAVRAFNKIK